MINPTSFSADVIQRIVEENLEIAEIELFTPTLSPMLQERVELDEVATEIVASGNGLRSGTSLPFWDGVMLAAMKATKVSPRIFEAAKFHNASSSGVTKISRENVSASLLSNISVQRDVDRIVAISSKVSCTDGVVKHIPQIDFHCAESHHSEELVVAILAALELRGYVLASGKSYHFYGRDLIEESRFAQFLGRVLLYAPIVDRAWIGHQLIEGKSGLRISSRPGYGGAPKLVRTIS